MKTLSIILVNYNSINFILNNIKVFDCLTKHGVKTIVVSNSGQCPELEAFPFLKTIVQPNNVGFGRACNVGARLANSDYLMFVNPDTILSVRAVLALRDFAEKNPSCGTMSPIIGSSKTTAVSDRITLTQKKKHNAIGACFVISRKLFEDVGEFDESFFLWFEDTDLRDRIKQAGWRIGFANGITLQHSGAHSTKDRTGPKDQILAIVGSVSGLNYRLKHQGLSVALMFIVAMILKNFGKIIFPHTLGRSTCDSLPFLKLKFGLFLLKNLPRLEQVLAFDGIGFPWARNIEEAMKKTSGIDFKI